MLASSELKGKTALVTGAGRGLGRAIALAYAKAGANLVLWSRTSTEIEEVAGLAREMGVVAAAQVVDVADVTHLRAAAETAIASAGRIDVLVNNAGVSNRLPFLECTEADFDRVMTLNLKATYFLTQTVAKSMASHKSGRIINISSVSSLRCRANSSLYATSKAALNTLTKILAIELGPLGITVNAIAPSFVRTPLTEDLFRNSATLEPFLKATPLGRFPEVDDVAAAAMYLASEAGRSISGQILAVDGGRTAA